jgi:hypothetical protein
MRWSGVWARLTRNSEVSAKRGSFVTVFTVDLWLLAVSGDLSFGNVSTRLFSRSDCGLLRNASISYFQSYPDGNAKESSEGANWETACGFRRLNWLSRFVPSSNTYPTQLFCGRFDNGRIQPTLGRLGACPMKSTGLGCLPLARPQKEISLKEENILGVQALRGYAPPGTRSVSPRCSRLPAKLVRGVLPPSAQGPLEREFKPKSGPLFLDMEIPSVRRDI